MHTKAKSALPIRRASYHHTQTPSTLYFNKLAAPHGNFKSLKLKKMLFSKVFEPIYSSRRKSNGKHQLCLYRTESDLSASASTIASSPASPPGLLSHSRDGRVHRLLWQCKVLLNTWRREWILASENRIQRPTEDLIHISINLVNQRALSILSGQLCIYNTIRRHYYLPNLGSNGHRTVRSCHSCAKSGVKVKRKRHIQPFPCNKTARVCIIWYLEAAIQDDIQQPARRN